MNAPLYKLSRHEVHAWLLTIDNISDNERLQASYELLSADEIGQYHRFRFQPDKHRYLVAHAMLRRVLSAYLGLSPADLEFTRSLHGKPEILDSMNDENLRFNLTHSGDLVACVITKAALCGIDAEQHVLRNATPDVAKMMFSTREYQAMLGREDDQYIERFFTSWTLREAYVKAIGVGIDFPTRKLHFDLENGDVLATFDNDIDDDPAQWAFRLHFPVKGYSLAIAVKPDSKTGLEYNYREFVF